MAQNDNLNDFLVGVADSIRERKGTTDLINPQDFAEEISTIGGSGEGGIKIVGSVDELDPDARIGTIACVASETETDATVQLYIKKLTWEPFKTGGMTVVDSYDKLDPNAAVGEMATVFVPESGGEKSVKDLVPGDVIAELILTNNWDYKDSFTITCTNPQGENVTIEWYVSWDCSDFTMSTPERTYYIAEYGDITSDWEEAKEYVENNPLTFVSVTDNIANIDSFLTVGMPSIGGTELYYKKEKSWESVAVDIVGLGNVMTVDSVKKLPVNAPDGSIASVGIPSTLKEDVIENISQGTRISKIEVSSPSQRLGNFEVLLHDESGNAMQIKFYFDESSVYVSYNEEYYYMMMEYGSVLEYDVANVTKLLTSQVFTFQGITSGSASDINQVLKFTSGSKGSADLYYKNNGWKKLSSELSTSTFKEYGEATVVPKEYLQLVDYDYSTIYLSNPDNLAMPEYLFEIKCNNRTPYSLIFYTKRGYEQINVLWANEDAPVFEVGYTYVISIMNNMAVYASFKHQ